MDHVFALHCLIDVYLQRNFFLFCAFIDYKKVDSVIVVGKTVKFWCEWEGSTCDTC